MNRIERIARRCGRTWRACWPRALICAMAVLAMTSCSTGTAATQGNPPPAPPPPIAPSLLQPCPTLPAAPDDRWGTLLENHDQVAGLYHDCRSGKAALIAAAREWSETAWAWYCQAVTAAGVKADGCPRRTVRADPRPGASP